jgi:hypothetical protein
VALAVYLALTELASNKTNDEFQQTLGKIALTAGTSVASVKRVLAGLVSAGVLEIVPNPPGMSIYRLIGQAQTDPAQAQTDPAQAQTDPAQAQGRNRGGRATLEEYKNLSEERERRSAAPAAPLPDSLPLSQTGLSKYEPPPATSDTNPVARLFLRMAILDYHHKKSPRFTRDDRANWKFRAESNPTLLTACLDDLEKALQARERILDLPAWADRIWKQRGGAE